MVSECNQPGSKSASSFHLTKIRARNNSVEKGSGESSTPRVGPRTSHGHVSGEGVGSRHVGSFCRSAPAAEVAPTSADLLRARPAASADLRKSPNILFAARLAARCAPHDMTCAAYAPTATQVYETFVVLCSLPGGALTTQRALRSARRSRTRSRRPAPAPHEPPRAALAASRPQPLRRSARLLTRS
jgi:hypothetical protein